MSEQVEVKKVIVIGGVAAGATAAAKLRRISEKVEITLIERGSYVSFANWYATEVKNLL